LIIDRLISTASQRARRIAFADAHDLRVQQAALRCADRGVCRPLLVAASIDEAQNLHQILAPSGVEVTHVDLHSDRTTAHLLARRSAKGLTATQAAQLSRDPLYVAGTLVATGNVDGAMAGSVSTTPDVVRAALWTIGCAPGISVVSSFFLMAWPDACMVYADCGVVPEPTSEQLTDIAASAAENFRKLTGEDPRVAFLSFSTRGSASHSSVDKVRSAFERFRLVRPDVLADGELQFDAATVPSVADRKASDSVLKGNSNVLIFPDLNAGNIAYKITQRLGGAVALGPILQGLAKPYCDLSRGCTADDIVLVAAITSLMSD
jgi:phosphate acetyltransferase